MKHFYTHLITTTQVEIKLSKLKISPEEKKKLSHLIYTNIHIAIVDRVLAELPEDGKKRFLLYAKENDHEKIWNLLSKETIKIEEKIKKTVKDLLEEFMQDIDSTLVS